MVIQRATKERDGEALLEVLLLDVLPLLQLQEALFQIYLSKKLDQEYKHLEHRLAEGLLCPHCLVKRLR